MPGLDSTLAQIIFAFVMIGLFALILRWTFSRDDRDYPYDAEPTDTRELTVSSDPSPPANGPDTGAMASQASLTPLAAAAPSDEDFGLLSTAAIVDTVEQAQRARTVLSLAGIRATIATGSDGRHRVLVFEQDLALAKRVIDRPL